MEYLNDTYNGNTSEIRQDLKTLNSPYWKDMLTKLQLITFQITLNTYDDNRQRIKQILNRLSETTDKESINSQLLNWERYGLLNGDEYKELVKTGVAEHSLADVLKIITKRVIITNSPQW